MSDPMDEILQMFFAEAQEGLEAAEANLARLAGGEVDAEALNVVFRAAPT
jgi:chemotaxis protein histidine kinase CheA